MARNRLRIAVVTSGKFGLTQFIYRDIESLKRLGHDVRLYMLHNEPGTYEPLPTWDVTQASRLRAAVSFVRTALRKPGPVFRLLRQAFATRTVRDLVIATQFAPTIDDADVIFAYFGDHKLFVAHYVKLLCGVPLTVTVRAYELYRNPNPEMFVEALANCDEVLTITDFNKAQLAERFGVPPEKISIARQIVDLDTHRPKEVTTILAVGFFAEKKGYDILLEALAQIDREDVELWIAGDTTPTVLATDVRALAAELGVSDRVAFFGSQSGPALRALYREADIFCLSSRTDRLGDKEGFPNVIAEAMAFGKPVVSTRHAGIPEAIEEVLVDENDAEQLAGALRSVIDSPDLRAQLGEENRARAEAMFTKGNTDIIVEVLQRAASAKAEN